jgi:hypothetical protein
MMDADTLFFFDGRPEELALYEALLEKISGFGTVRPVVHKTQISLKNRRVFACVSMARVVRRALLPPHYLVLTLGLPYPLDSPRIAVKVEAQHRRWTHHIVLGTESALDEELMGWVHEAYMFGNR